MSAAIAAQLGAGFKAIDWTRTQGSLFSAMKMEKTMIGLLLLLIVAVAAFNIVTTQTMLVKDKRRDIAILRTVGARRGSVLRVFLMCGAAIGVLGNWLVPDPGLALALVVLVVLAVVASIVMLIRPCAYSPAASARRLRSAATWSWASRTRSFQLSSGPRMTARLSGLDSQPSSAPVT